MELPNTTQLDQWGYPVTTTSDTCIAALNLYYNQVLAYGRNREVILEAVKQDSECVLANTLAAHFLFHRNPSEALNLLSAAASRLEEATLYEKAVFRSVSKLVVDEVDDAAALRAHSELLNEFPKDLVSLKRVQNLCFYVGRPDLSLKFVEKVLSYNEGESYTFGMLAFPLLELGRMADAEVAAKKGLEINMHDFWSQHNLCHVYQNECHFKEAVGFMEACSPSWNSCSSFMLTHNWWHVAVCYLEGHSALEKVLDIYDNCIMKELEKTDAVSGEVYLNALGLLLRIYVRGRFDDIEVRLKILANAFTNKSNWHIEWLLDVLALWALAATKMVCDADGLLNSMKSRVHMMSWEKQQPMQRGIMLAEALYEYGKGNLQKMFDVLGPKFDAIDCKIIGASDEQLDVFNELWYTVLLNTGHGSEAAEEIERRVKKRVGVPFLWRLLEKAYSMDGHINASFASEKAEALETAYFK